jgi:hypothetical protein
MAEVELNLNELTVPELLATAAGVASALEDNVHFPAPQPPPAELDQMANELSTAEDAYREQRLRSATAKAKRDQAAEALRQALGKEVAYVQKQSGGEVAKILSANLHVQEETSLWPFGKVGAIDELSVSMGDQPGEIDLAWDPVASASGYEVEIAYDLNGEGPWEQSGATTSSKLTIEKLNNRTRYWFRVRAVGERGPGEWSEAVMKFAP